MATNIASEKTNIPDETVQTENHINVNNNNTDKNNFSMTEIAIEASEIINRLGLVAEGATLNDEAFEPQTVYLNLQEKQTSEILTSIEGLVCGDDPESNVTPVLDETGKLVLISHSIASYIGSLDKYRVKKINAKLMSDTTRWIDHIFGLLDCGVYFHDDQLEGLVKVTRMVLHYKYPRYVEGGALVLTTSLPTIYSSVASPLGVVQHLCQQLGLPSSCVRPVPVNTVPGSQYTMDVSILQRMITDDFSSGRIPLIVIGDVGTPITGHVDDVRRLYEICKEHDIWLHLRGHGLASLILPYQQNGPIERFVDSFTAPLGQWLGIPGLPTITLYKLWNVNVALDKSKIRTVGTSRESTLPMIAGLTMDHHQRRVSCLPWWVCLQALGRGPLRNRIRDSFLACERIWSEVEVYRHVRILSYKLGEIGSIPVEDYLTKSPSKLLTIPTGVVFQFIPEVKENEVLNRVPPYYDKLNSWLGQILQLDAPQIPLEICELETSGVVLRFCPFENLTGQQPTDQDIDSFISSLEQQLIILQATVQQKENFYKLVEESPVLKLVEMPDWAGLGGVRYAPEGWEQLLTDQAKEELNNLNIALVDALRSTDSAFSLGEGVDGLVCVRFGMLTAQSDVEELLNLVIKVGKSVEENSRVLDSMSEIVKKGIETATMDLQKENEERLWQEGILRHVPVVGSLVNWWSPRSKETGVKGRSLNLTQGVVESTENIYRYHMQLQSGTAPAGTKSPPTPLVQTPVGGGTGGSHSRSSSHASASSQGAAPPPPIPVPATATAIATATANTKTDYKETEKINH